MADPQLPQMLDDVSGLIDAWGKRSFLSRASGTVNGSGRFSGTFVTKASGTVFVQTHHPTPFEQTEPGLKDHTHLVAFAHKTLPAQGADRLRVSGVVYEYDVVDVEDYETHTLLYLRQLRKR